MWQHGSKHVQPNMSAVRGQHLNVWDTGLQQSTRTTCTPQNDCSQKYRNGYSPGWDSAPYSSHTLTSSTENSARTSSEDSGHYFKDSHLSSDGLQQEQLLNSDSSVDIRSAVRQEDGLCVASKCTSSSVHENKKSSPLLTYLLTKDDFELSHVLFSPSERTRVSAALHHYAHLRTTTRSSNEEAPQRSVSSPSASAQTLLDNMPLPTDEEILYYIKERVKAFRSELYQQTRGYKGNQHKKEQDVGSDGKASALWSTGLPSAPESSSLSTPHPTSLALKGHCEKQVLGCAVREQCRATCRQTPEGDPPEDLNMKAASKVEENDGYTTSERHPTDAVMSAVTHWNDAPECKSDEKSAAVELDLKRNDTVEMSEGQINMGDSWKDKICDKYDESSLHTWHHKSFKNSALTTLHYSLTALKTLVSSLENVETSAEMDNFSEIIAKRYWNGDKDNIHLFASTEYPEIMLNVAATCTKHEEESPVVLTTVSGMTLDNLTEKQPNKLLEEGQDKSVWVNATSADGFNKHPAVPAGFQHTQQPLAGKSPPLPFKDCPAESGTLLSEDKPVDIAMQVESQQTPLKDAQFQTVRVEMVSVHSQTAINGPLTESKCAQVPLGSVEPCDRHMSLEIKDPQYEDITDEENVLVSQRPSAVSESRYDGSRLIPCFKDPQYEDISEEENSESQEPVLVLPPSQSDGEQCLDGEDHGHSQSEMKMNIPEYSVKTEVPDLAQDCLSCGPCGGVLKVEDNGGDQVGDGEWILVPLLISDLTFEPADDQDAGQTTSATCDPQLSVPEPEEASTSLHPSVPEPEEASTSLHPSGPEPEEASASLQLPLFNTIQGFLDSQLWLSWCPLDLVDSSVSTNRSTPEQELDTNEGLNAPASRGQDCSEDENSCETEDSCDYSSGPEKNRLTVPKQLLHTATVLSSETEDSLSEKEDVGDEQNGTGMSLKTQNSANTSCMQKLRELIKAKDEFKQLHNKGKKRKIWKKKKNISIDLDTDDECSQSLAEKAKEKRLSSPRLEDSPGIPVNQHNGPSAEDLGSYCGTGDGRFQEARPSQCMPHLSNTDHPQRTRGKDHSETRLSQCMSHCSNTDHPQRTSGKDHSETRLSQCMSHRSNTDHPQRTRGKDHSETRPSQCMSHLSNTDHPQRTRGKDHSETRPSQCMSHLSNTDHPQRTKGKDQSDGIQCKTIPKTSPGEIIILDSDTEDEVAPRRMKTVKRKSLLSESSDGFPSQTVFLPDVQDGDGQTGEDLLQRPAQSLEDSADQNPQPVDLMVSRPILTRLLFCDSNESSDFLKLCNVSTDNKNPKDGVKVPSKPVLMSERSGPCRKDVFGLEKKGDKKNKKAHQSLDKCPAVPRPRSLSNQEGASSYSSGLLSSERQFSETKKTSSKGFCQSRQHCSSSSAPTSKQNLATCRSTLKRHSSAPETSSSSLLPSAKKQVISEWSTSYIPTRRDRKTGQRTEKDSRTSPNVKNTPASDLCLERRLAVSNYDGPPRPKHRSESKAPLMKKSLSLAKLCTKAVHRETPNDKRSSVGEGYKWSEKATKASKAKGSHFRFGRLEEEEKLT